MENEKKQKRGWLILIILLLLVCLTITTFTLVSRFNDFMPDSSDAIPLIPDDDDDADDNNGQGTEGDEFVAQPGFEVSDSQGVWNTDTRIEIFHVYYENGEAVATVRSNGTDKVIAPGTENSYTFKLRNTGNVALDYEVEVDAYVSPSDLKLPVDGRMNRYDNKWLIGGTDQYEDVLSLDTAKDTMTLAAGRYATYTLDWRWLYEQGNDALDTALGDRAIDEDLMLTIAIRTTATESADPHGGGGILPQTGDDNHTVLWATLAGCALIMMVFLIFSRDEEEKKQRCKK